MKRMFIIFLCLVGFSYFSTVNAAKLPPNAAIASANRLATEAGLMVLRQGGNAFDAAIAVSSTLSVVEPYMSGAGGGGFWLLHQASTNKNVMIDSRERAPLAATRTMYLDKHGNVIQKASLDGPLAAGVPGIVAAWAKIARDYGKLPLSKSMSTAINLARLGYPLTEELQRWIAFRHAALKASTAAAAIFLDKGQVPKLGFVIRQTDLANTLSAIATHGETAFYSGKIAALLVDGVHKAGGIWTIKDLEQYKLAIRKPLTGKYHGYTITTVAPPSSGGVALLTMLDILKHYDLQKLKPITARQVIVEAMRRAYWNRAEFLGDPDFIKVPVKRLLSRKNIAFLTGSIKLNQATPSASLPKHAVTAEGMHTTHFSILDAEGNAVAATLSLNYPFGSGFVAPGTGVILNDEMDDFSSKPGVPNVYGLIGGEANAIAPGKRMLSSMTPTFMENSQRLVILGTPGGSRIISSVLLAILALDSGKTTQQAVSQKRFHHQYLPDEILFESGAFTLPELTALKKMGYALKAWNGTYGNMQIVLWDKVKNQVQTASDPRGKGFGEIVQY